MEKKRRFSQFVVIPQEKEEETKTEEYERGDGLAEVREIFFGSFSKEIQGIMVKEFLEKEGKLKEKEKKDEQQARKMTLMKVEKMLQDVVEDFFEPNGRMATYDWVLGRDASYKVLLKARNVLEEIFMTIVEKDKALYNLLSDQLIKDEVIDIKQLWKELDSNNLFKRLLKNEKIVSKSDYDTVIETIDDDNVLDSFSELLLEFLNLVLKRKKDL
jgi:hypothetical protein